MIELIYVKITLVCESECSFTKRVLFFLYKKVLRERGCKGMAFDALTLQKIEVKKQEHNYFLHSCLFIDD